MDDTNRVQGITYISVVSNSNNYIIIFQYMYHDNFMHIHSTWCRSVTTLNLIA